MVEVFLDNTIRAINEHKPDILHLGGDWLDRPISLTSASASHVLDAMNIIVGVCAKKGITLWVLQGTGSHDGTQGLNWGPLAKAYPELNFRYFDEVDIVREFDMDILVIPDSVIPDFRKCEAVIRAKMIERGIDKVDFGVTHGMYLHHAEAAGYHAEGHDHMFYSSITRMVILNGHIHRPGLHCKVLDGGSFNRLRQGENHPKGAFIITLYPEDDDWEALFLENKDAAIFNSYELVNQDANELLDELRPKLSELKGLDIFIRLHYHESVPIRAVERILAEEYDHIVFDTVPNSKAIEAKRAQEEIVLSNLMPEGIHPKTVVPLTMDKLERLKIKFTPLHETILKEIRDAVT